MYVHQQGPTYHQSAAAITDSSDLAAHFTHLQDLLVEEIWMTTVGPDLVPIATHMVARGGRAVCSTDLAVIARIALLDNAFGCFLAHNHPSGDPAPSPQDIAFTRRAKEGLKILSIGLYDHIVVTRNNFRSCKP